jgi:nitroreductase
MNDTQPALFDTMFNMRAMRRLKPDPVGTELVEQILRAGQAAPNGGNAQAWGFIVVEDPAIKKQIQSYYAKAYADMVGPHYAAIIDAMEPGAGRDKFERQVAATRHLTDHYHEAPVMIVACLNVGPNGANGGSGASIYPAVQNMLLAARGLGLGATLTSRHMIFGEEVDKILALPDGIVSFAILPIGYPEGNFGPVGRGPISDIVHKNQWGQDYF